MKFKNKLITSISAFAVGFSIAFGGAAIVEGNKTVEIPTFEQTTPELPEYVESPQRKLLNNILSTQGFEVSGEINLRTENNFLVELGIDAKGDLSDLNNFKLNGELDLYLNGIELSANIDYFENTLYFATEKSKFYLDTDNLMDFIDFLPELGLNLSLPEELTNLDLNTITALIEGMEEIVTPAGDYFFKLSISDLVELNIKTDNEYSFKGIYMNPIVFEGTTIDLDLDMKKIEITEDTFVNPSTTVDFLNYVNFKPAFGIFTSLYNTFKSKQNTIVLDAKVAKEEDSLFDASIDFSYDIENLAFDIAGKVFENERNHVFDAHFLEDTIYFGYNDLKVSVETTTIFTLVRFILDKLEIDVTQELLNLVVELLNSEELTETLGNIKNLIGDFTLQDDLFSIDIDTEAIGLGMGTIKVQLETENEALKAIKINGLKVLGISVDLALSTKTYVKYELLKDSYQSIEPVLTLVDAIMPLIEQTQFRIEFDGKVTNKDAEVKDVTIDGGLQFDIEDLFGFGELNIKDRNEYTHKVEADMTNGTNFLFSYNDTLNGKFSFDTLNDLVDLLLDIVQNPDEHFMELFGEIIEALQHLPLMEILNGNIGLLLDTNLINSIEISETKININLSLEIIGIEKSLDVEINFHHNYETEKSYIDSLKVSGLELNDDSVELNFYIKDYDKDLETTRLDPNEQYLDFSDIKVLLELGINTSKFDYFHFKSNLALTIGSIIEWDIPLDIKIRNDKGNVQVAVEFEKIPVIDGVLGVLNINGNKNYLATTGRTASFYYEGDSFYLRRVDLVDNKVLGFGKAFTVTYSKTMDVDYFLDNVAEVLLKDLLGINNDIYNTIIDSSDTSGTTQTSTQIEYEDILQDFGYNPDNGTFKFTISLYSLLHISVLKDVDLIVYSDQQINQLTGIEAKLTIRVLLNINISLKIDAQEMTTLDDSNKLDVMDSWVLAHQNDELNKLIKVSEVKR